MNARARNLRVVLPLVAFVAAMVGVAYASVPLYRLFCQWTGYEGTTQRADAAPAAVSERTITVRFNADVARDLPWRFQPVERQVTVRLGQSTLAYYRAENLADRPVTGRATFNVTPDVTGAYFSKIHCFCFDEQTLRPGETVDMGVEFFVDPKILDDPETAGLPDITLSYTFFRAPDAADGAAALAAPGVGVVPGSLN